MACVIVVDQPNEGIGIYIHGLGTFANGEHEITDEMERNYRVVHMTDHGHHDSDAGVYVPKHVLGPALRDTIRGMSGVSIKGDESNGENNGPKYTRPTSEGPDENQNVNSDEDEDEDEDPT